MPGIAPTPGMTPPGGSTSKPVFRSLLRLGGGDSERDLSLSFLLLCLSLLLDLLRLSRLCRQQQSLTSGQQGQQIFRTGNSVRVPASPITSSTGISPVKLRDLKIKASEHVWTMATHICNKDCVQSNIPNHSCLSSLLLSSEALTRKGEKRKRARPNLGQQLSNDNGLEACEQS